MGKRKFAGGNPFVSRKKYKGKLFNLPKKESRATKLKRIAAKASGAALGAILGNVPGAYVGYNVGGAAANWAAKRGKRKVVKKAQVKRASSTHNDLTIHSLGSISMNRYPKKPDTKCKAVLVNKSNFILNGSLAAMGVNGTIQGNQAVDYLDEICHRNWFVTNLNDDRFDRSRLATDLYKFAVDNTYTFTGYSGEIVRQFADQRIYIDYVDLEYGLLSMTTVPQIVDVYFCSSKFDCAENPLTKLETGSHWEGNGQRIHVTAFNTTTVNVTDGVPNPVTGRTKNEWGHNPWGVTEFRKTYNCLKKVSMTLNPGDQRHYKLRVYYKQFIDKTTFSNFRTQDHLKGLTITPLVVARAGLVGIKTEAGAEAVEVAYGKAKVGVTTKMTVNMKACLAPRFQPMVRYHEGIQIGTTDIVQEIDDEDNVKPVEVN